MQRGGNKTYGTFNAIIYLIPDNKNANGFIIIIFGF